MALALQTLLAMFSLQKFYESLAQATYDYTALASFAEPALIPGRWLGMILCATQVAVQICLVSAVAAYFLARTRVSAIGNSWQTVAQMVSGTTMPVLEQAGSMTDDGVKELIREQQGKETATEHGVLKYRGGRVGFKPT